MRLFNNLVYSPEEFDMYRRNLRKKMIPYLIFLLIFGIGCASRQERLKKNYDVVSTKIKALREESKAVVTLEISAEKCLKAWREYERKKLKLQKIQKENKEKGLSVVPEASEDLTWEKEIEYLEKYRDTLSTLIRSLEKRRNKIVKEQTKDIMNEKKH